MSDDSKPTFKIVLFDIDGKYRDHGYTSADLNSDGRIVFAPIEFRTNGRWFRDEVITFGTVKVFTLGAQGRHLATIEFFQQIALGDTLSLNFDLTINQ
jgi:hypothetical protein